VAADETAPARTPEGQSGYAGTVRTNLFVSGSYAWLATVAAPTFSSGKLGPAITASAALILLVTGLLLAPRWPQVGRAVTMGGLLGPSVVTWILLGEALDISRLEPIRSASGAVGWMLFAFGWGAVRNVRSVPENDPRVIEGTPLQPRQTLPWLTYVVFGVAAVGGFAPWLLAWRVARPDHALLAHVVGLLCAVGLISVGAHVAVRRVGRWAPAPPTARIGTATNAFVALAVVLVLGIVLWLVRS
jgi:hypothetical protein